MRKRAYGYAHILVEAEYEQDPTKDEKYQAMRELESQARKKFGISPRDYEFSDGIQVFNAY